MTTPTAARPRTLDETRLIHTKNDLPLSTRAEAVALLNQRLADCIDLQTMCKQAHWNVKGPSFYQLHLLFDEVNGAVTEYIDLIAERIVQLGGVAEGRRGLSRGVQHSSTTRSRSRPVRNTLRPSRTSWRSSGERRG